jgi:hypothetical protein
LTKRTLDLRSLRYIRCHGYADAAEQLNTLGDGINEFDLLVEVLIEEQMQLVEPRPCDLPVRFLVQIAEGHGIRKELVEQSFPTAPVHPNQGTVSD